MKLDHLEIREVFHIEFLRRLSRTLGPSTFVLKGGTNLRFFYQSFRYSEDMDIDIKDEPVHSLRDKVMEILTAKTFAANLKTFGITEVIPPDISKAKQTETVQRFKAHLITSSGEDLFTKIEFSRRGFDEHIKAEGVSSDILNRYKLAPLIISHYLVGSVVKQKISALMQRKVTQARDIFDLYVLSTQADPLSLDIKKHFSAKDLREITERIDTINYGIYKDTVVSYLGIEEQKSYGTADVWDEIRLKVINFIEKGLK